MQYPTKLTGFLIPGYFEKPALFIYLFLIQEHIWNSKCINSVLSLPWKQFCIISAPRALTQQCLCQRAVEIMSLDTRFLSQSFIQKWSQVKQCFYSSPPPPSFCKEQHIGVTLYMEDVLFLKFWESKIFLSHQATPKMCLIKDWN